jgi:hypothetical protein
VPVSDSARRRATPVAPAIAHVWMDRGCTGQAVTDAAATTAATKRPSALTKDSSSSAKSPYHFADATAASCSTPFSALGISPVLRAGHAACLSMMAASRCSATASACCRARPSMRCSIRCVGFTGRCTHGSGWGGLASGCGSRAGRHHRRDIPDSVHPDEVARQDRRVDRIVVLVAPQLAAPGHDDAVAGLRDTDHVVVPVVRFSAAARWCSQWLFLATPR